MSIHNCEDPSNSKIVDITSIDEMVKAFEEVINSIPDITFSQEIYEEFLSKGILELRGRVTTEDAGEYEKGIKLLNINIVF